MSNYGQKKEEEKGDIDYSKVSHQYMVKADLEANNVAIVITVTDSVTNKTWTYSKQKDYNDQKGVQLAAEYDKIKTAIESGQGNGVDIGEFPGK